MSDRAEAGEVMIEADDLPAVFDGDRRDDGVGDQVARGVGLVAQARNLEDPTVRGNAGMRPTPARARRSVRRRRASRQTTARTAAWWGWSALCSQQQLVGDGNHGAHEALSSASGASPIPSSLVAVRPIPTRRRRRTGTARGAGIAPGLSCRGTGATLLRDKPVRCRSVARQLSTGT